MYKITFPNNDGFDPIENWSWRDGSEVNLIPGDSFLTDNVEKANDFKRIFSFCTLESVDEDVAVEQPQAPKKKIEVSEPLEVESNPTEDLPTDFLSLRKIAKGQGINVVGLNKEQILNALEEAK